MEEQVFWYLNQIFSDELHLIILLGGRRVEEMHYTSAYKSFSQLSNSLEEKFNSTKEDYTSGISQKVII